MIRVAKETRLEPVDIIERASRFFGKGGEELTETERSICCIAFEGMGGHVAVTVTDDNKCRTVDIETREFEYQVNQFLETL